MKKILFALVALVCSMSMNAQVMKVMKGNTVVATYTAEQADNVVFEEASATTALTFTALVDDSTISFNLGDTQYKKGDGEWTAYTAGDVITLNNGETVQFKAAAGSTRNTLFTDDENFGMFTMDNGSFAANGSVMSLLGEGQDMGDYAFYMLFMGCSGLKQAPELPAETLSEKCYYGMFAMTGLTDTPKLPATTLADGCYAAMFVYCPDLTSICELPAETMMEGCYTMMFEGCTSLTEAPALPAETLAANCYHEMFYGCSGLIATPALPAETLAEDCYYRMFQECTSLTTVTGLPATTLAKGCYERMFADCTSLVNAPALPATTLAQSCYSHMFANCTNLVNAPELPATTLITNCYYGLFDGCSNLASVKVAFTDWMADNFTTIDWLNGVAATGTFTCPAGLADKRGINNIPEGWTKQSLQQ